MSVKPLVPISLQVNVTLPGKVESTTGVAQDGVLTWRVATDGTPVDLATTTNEVDVAGTIGGILSFVARALHTHVNKIKEVSILAVFALPPAVSLLTANVTSMLSGNLEFTSSWHVCALAACGTIAYYVSGILQSH